MKPHRQDRIRPAFGVAAVAFACISATALFFGCAEQHAVSTAAPPAPITAAAWIEMLIRAESGSDPAGQQQAQEDFERCCTQSTNPADAAGKISRAALCKAMCSHLDEQTPHAARVWMLRMLTLIGDDESVSTLSALLSSPDAEIADLARRALEKNDAASADFALCRALLAARADEARIAYMNSLAARHSDAVGNMTLNEWHEFTTPAMQTAAIVVCGAAGTHDAAEALLRIGNQWPNYPLALALLRAADDCLQETPDAAARSTLLDAVQEFIAPNSTSTSSQPILIDQLRHSRDSWPPRLALLTRFAVARLKLLGIGPTTFSTISGILTPSPWNALQSVELAYRQQSIPDLYSVTAYAHGAAFDDFLATTIQAGGVLWEPFWAPFVLRAATVRGVHCRANWKEWLDSDDFDTRIAVLEYLARCGTTGDIPLLVSTAADQHGLVRETAERALAHMPGRDVDTAVVKGTEQLTVFTAAQRAALTRTIASRYLRSERPLLFKLSEDSAAEVRVAAFAALADVGRAEDLPNAVTRFAAASNDETRKAAEDCVVQIANRIDDAAHRADALLAALPAAKEMSRENLVRALGRVGGPAALAAVRAARRDDNPLVVAAAIRALANWPDVAALNDVREIAEASTDDTHRALALRAFVRLLRLSNGRSAAEQFALAAQALKLAHSDAEKKLAIGALGDIPTTDALNTVMPLLDNADCRPEAAAAIVQIARVLAAEEPSAARNALRRVQALPDLPDTVMKSAKDAGEIATEFGGCIGRWSFAGPYVAEGKKADALYDIAFAPEKPGEKIDWKPLTAHSSDNPWIFDLSKLDSGTDRCIYVRAVIVSPQDQDARLDIGSDDGYVAWLDGKMIQRKTIARGVTPGEDKIDITLQRGRNELMLKVVQAAGGWGFICDVRSRTGEALRDLEYRAE